LYGWHHTGYIVGEYESMYRYIADGDTLVSNSVPGGANQGYLMNFPNTIKIEKIKLNCNYTIAMILYISNDSTDGFDGNWTTVNSSSTTANVYGTFNCSPVNDTKWLKIYFDTPGNVYLRCLHIFGTYQSPLFEFWDDSESARFTADYPLSLADAPNDADYAGTLNFKLKNTDSGTHSYSLTIVPVKYNADAIITDHFTLSVDGGSTKLLTVTVSSLGAGNFSGSIGVYGDVTKAHNPANGNHYFAVHVAVTA
jgi:hypothetical protein